jgi:hypothetical protein
VALSKVGLGLFSTAMRLFLPHSWVVRGRCKKESRQAARKTTQGIANIVLIADLLNDSPLMLHLACAPTELVRSDSKLVKTLGDAILEACEDTGRRPSKMDVSQCLHKKGQDSNPKKVSVKIFFFFEWL